MKLPDSEIKRIGYTWETSAQVHAAAFEALLWYERMGKFAEWVHKNNWRFHHSQEGTTVWQKSAIHFGELKTTPELINKFLKIK